MRIGIDARFYGPRVGGGGIGRYVAELLTHLQLLDQKNTYTLFLKKDNFHECVITNPRFVKRMVDVHWYGLKEQVAIPRAVRESHVDFMHYPHWNTPLFSRTPFVVTIHDLILLEDKTSAHSTTHGAFVHGFKYAGFRTALENAIHRSRHILTVSEYSKKRILDHFRIKSSKITVIPNGVSTPSSSKNVSLTGLGVYEPYFLYVGSAYPHKNLEMMMHAFSAFREKNGSVQLVIAGRRDVFSRRLEKEAQDLHLGMDAIRFVDFPSDEELAKLYTHANLFIFPSRIEGFGIPPLEAFTLGTPVAAARSASLPEVLGEHAEYFEPDDIERLTQIMHGFTKRGHSTNANNSRMRHAAKFSWLHAAERTLAVYNRFPSL